MRVLIRWQDLTPAQRALRREQLLVRRRRTLLLLSSSVLMPTMLHPQAARQAATDAGALEDVAALTADLAYEARAHVSKARLPGCLSGNNTRLRPPLAGPA